MHPLSSGLIFRCNGTARRGGGKSRCIRVANRVEGACAYYSRWNVVRRDAFRLRSYMRDEAKRKNVGIVQDAAPQLAQGHGLGTPEKATQAAPNRAPVEFLPDRNSSQKRRGLFARRPEGGNRTAAATPLPPRRIFHGQPALPNCFLRLCRPRDQCVFIRFGREPDTRRKRLPSTIYASPW